jgi:putative oxidoreductase
LLALLFVFAGFNKLTGFEGAVQMVAGAGFPMPTLMTALAVIFELGGGLMLLLGFHARMAAWMLIVFTAIATAAFHMDFSQQMNTIMFLKNVSIIGGLLYVTAVGAGKWSLAHWDTKLCMGGDKCPDCKAANTQA